MVVATAADRFARCQSQNHADVVLIFQPPSLPTSHHRHNNGGGGGARFHLVDYEEEDAQLIAQYYKCPQPVYEASIVLRDESALATLSDTVLPSPLTGCRSPPAAERRADECESQQLETHLQNTCNVPDPRKVV